MKRPGLCRYPNLRRLPWLASGLCAAGLPWLAIGCADPLMAPVEPGAPLTALSMPVITRAADSEPAGPPAAEAQRRAVPISMDTVLRLTGDQNKQITIAREKVREATVDKDIADLGWLPAIYVGSAYWRHEGGIQDPDGSFIHSSSGAMFEGMEMDARVDIKEYAFQKVNAERKVWQQRGELSKTTSDTLMEAANTYIDLLQARTGEVIGLQMEKYEQDMLKRARELADKEPPAKIQSETLEADAKGHKQALTKLHYQGDAAATKLANLLGLDSCVRLMPVDDRLAPFDLVDASPDVCELVQQALRNGPGIRELEGLLALVQDSMEKAKGPSMFMPIVELRMAEGGFGAGPGDSMTWDNRWDLGLQMRWNITQIASARDRQRSADSKLQQLYLAHQDLSDKLTAGVFEARSAIFSGTEQVSLCAEQICHANEAFKRTRERYLLRPDTDKVTELQVLQSLRVLELAHLRYLDVVSAYNKAQIRLMMLIGAGNGSSGGCCHAGPVAAAPTEYTSRPDVKPVAPTTQKPAVRQVAAPQPALRVPVLPSGLDAH
jgi:outer membrane protein TolC